MIIKILLFPITKLISSNSTKFLFIETCIHITVIKKIVMELETWGENEDPFGIPF